MARALFCKEICEILAHDDCLIAKSSRKTKGRCRSVNSCLYDLTGHSFRKRKQSVQSVNEW